MPLTPPHPVSSATRNRFVLAGVFSLLAWEVLGVVSPGGAIPWTPVMTRAALAMDSAVVAVGRFCRDAGVPMDRVRDPNQTCLVGPELSELLTSLGQMEAKRTTTSPDVAGLLAYLLVRAGVRPGDRVAVGASGSFPGFMVATLAAIRALGAEPVTVLSLGASSYGATRPGFHLLDLYRELEREGFVSSPPAGVSLGGSRDMGEEFEPEFRERLLRELVATLPGTVAILRDPDMRPNVAERVALYGSCSAFVNIGGAEMNLGASPRILDLPPGLVRSDTTGLPPEEQRGVVFEMMAREVPVIHLLHVRGLALRYGLPWDPIPLSSPGSTRLKDPGEGMGLAFWLLTSGYLAGLGLIGAAARGRRDDAVTRVSP